MEFFGWASTFLLTIGGFPQAYKTYKEGNAHGLSYGMVISWFIGEIFLVLYSLGHFNLPVLMNSVLNSCIAAFILRYKIFPRNSISRLSRL